jgi:hypothetical protein
MLHVECGVLLVRQESAEIYFIGCSKYTVDKFVHILTSRDEDECGFFQQDGVADLQPLSPWSPYVILGDPVISRPLWSYRSPDPASRDLAVESFKDMVY